MSNHVGRKRFVKLVNHLQTNRLVDFNMANFDSCAASYMPVVFPKFWMKDKYNRPCLRSAPYDDIYESLAAFFQVDEPLMYEGSNHLFANLNEKRQQIAMMKRFAKLAYEKE